MTQLARVLGICMQAIVLGTLLFFALVELIGLNTGARIFQYQGF